ncbi:MAG: hypothetical protein IIB44_02475 [Candidatus Marinimicrobia bacterium]|nr:hypothetical protein [Candidatus Neomarinimicrobiota bacterium]
MSSTLMTAHLTSNQLPLTPPNKRRAGSHQSWVSDGTSLLLRRLADTADREPTNYSISC